MRFYWNASGESTCHVSRNVMRIIEIIEIIAFCLETIEKITYKLIRFVEKKRGYFEILDEDNLLQDQDFSLD